MIKKIKASLLAKVFFITTIMLFCVSALTYGLLAWLMPQTYSNRLSDALDTQAKAFIAKLEQASLQDSGGLFDQFLQNENISYVELYNSSGNYMTLPQGRDSSLPNAAASAIQQGESANAAGSAIQQEESANAAGLAREMGLLQDEATAIIESDAVDTYENIPVVSNSYYFSFADDPAVYMLTVTGTAEQIAQLKHTFLQVLPLLFFLLLLAALSLSLLYAHMITRPVLQISRIAEKMSGLQLEWHLEETRADELGILAKSLNTLSQKLAATISGLQDANQKLARDIEHEKVLEQARLDFFSAVSHELKTPVTIIKGQLEGMLLGIGVYKDRKKYLARALEITGTLETMVQELLTVSRLETTGAASQTECFDCVAAIRDYLEATGDWIAQKRLQVCCEIPLTACVDGNKMLMEKVFSNLIGNAVKYSPDGAEIHISLRQDPDRLSFSVENTGTHIPEDCLPKLFDAFYRIDPSRNRKTGGSGLGLYIVQKILALHGSHCRVENTDRGVRFSFTFEKLHKNHTNTPKQPQNHPVK